jgi:hypothetical protein
MALSSQPWGTSTPICGPAKIVFNKVISAREENRRKNLTIKEYQNDHRA